MKSKSILFIIPIMVMFDCMIMFNATSSFNRIETKIDKSYEKVAKAEDNINNLSAGVETISNKTESLENKIAKVENDVTVIETEVVEVEKEIETLKVEPFSEKYRHDGNISSDTNLAIGSEIDIQEMNKIIDYWDSKAGGTPFKGRGETFIKAAKASGLDPVYLLSHAAAETGWGKSNIAQSKNNYYGIACFDSTPFDSAYDMGDSIDSGIINGAIWIRNNYYNEGCTSLHLMIYNPNKPAYASAKDEWIDTISSIWTTSYSLIS